VAFLTVLEPEGEAIGPRVAREAQRRVEAKLDESFFRVRADERPNWSFSTCARWRDSAPESRSPATSPRSWAEALTSSVRLVRVWSTRVSSETTGHNRGNFTVPPFDRYMLRNYKLAPPRPRW